MNSNINNGNGNNGNVSVNVSGVTNVMRARKNTVQRQYEKEW